MATETDQLRNHLDALPIFPLPKAVLLPYEVLPLHIFEPRYREMLNDMLTGSRPFAVAQLAAGWEGEYERRPPVEPLCGAGIVTRQEKLADGRYNILVRGIGRVRILSELPARHAYREVKAKIVEDTSTKTPAEQAEAMEELRRLLFSLCAVKPGPASGALAQLAARASESGALADIVIAALLTDFDKRKRALITLDPIARLGIARVAVAELLANATTTTDARLRN